TPVPGPGGRLIAVDGTSMAAAHVAGVAALLFQARPDAGVADVERALVESARPLAGDRRARQGRGLVDPLGALRHLVEGAPCHDRRG
ncbi:S8 family serine peptidase, partial [Actinoplanes sp. NPDC026623]|uniref:S8 family serine peptidase n=1 Tax=Actinoplanes sp. NPDC026623 TaxID=3155610 RepID=UPI0033DD3A99